MNDNNDLNTKRIEVYKIGDDTKIPTSPRVNQNITRVNTNIKNVQGSRPEPLTKDELEYYKRARKESEERQRMQSNKAKQQAKPISKQEKDRLAKPVRVKNTANSNAHSVNSQSNPNSNAQKNPSARDKEYQKYQEHLRKQAYYDAKYADTEDVKISYHQGQSTKYKEKAEPETQNRSSRSQLGTFLEFLLVFLVFLLLGAGFAYIFLLM